MFNKQNTFFTDENSLKTLDRMRIIYMLVAVIFYVLTESGRFIYRPYIYSNHINDYGLADSIGNLGGIITQIFFMLAVLNSPKIKALRIIAFVVIGYCLYEILQHYLPRGVFDIKDIYGTLIGGAVSLLLLLLFWRFVPNRTLFKFKAKN